MGASVCLQSPVCSRLTQLLVLDPRHCFSKAPSHRHVLSSDNAWHCGGVTVNVQTMGKHCHASSKNVCIYDKYTTSDEEQSGVRFLVHLIQHNLNFSAAKPN
ncbi:hypothetical protein E3U43_022426 [Larimichthys crocea]|uniref:Uncharacterized protein n=1 Tax=Larimichthys crocea TaxID=215358 RepID=A0ACD3R3A1_LARCR|nr:hypothetical protein E3U43_022426 [Larimichthys crocea]